MMLPPAGATGHETVKISDCPTNSVVADRADGTFTLTMGSTLTVIDGSRSEYS